MNFFEHQARARQKTTQLAILFGIAVGGIVVAIYLVTRLALRYAELKAGRAGGFELWDLQSFLTVAIVVTLFIGIASAAKMASLRRGGSAVAEMLGGRLVPRSTTDLAERRLLNVVEEIALASGVPVPQVYLLPSEEGINAFAAGHTPSDAAVAVTKGTLQSLSRDELQGVIAHEFSHILNSDMRLNIRLIGILFGILAIGIFGRILARVTSAGRGNRRGGLPAIALAGVLLMLIGYIGTFIGRLIQSAVSRQREFLADAAAVQFTRNPVGIAGALKKIGGHVHGSRIQSPAAEQASHLFFGQGRKRGLFGGLLATHPPLVERIQRIEPDFDGRFPLVGAERIAAAPRAARKQRRPQRSREGILPGFPPLPGFPGGEAAAFAGEAGLTAAETDPAGVVARVGQPTAGHLELGAALLRRIPEPLQATLALPAGAQSVMLALLLEPPSPEREQQLQALRPITPPPEVEALEALSGAVAELPRPLRLPLTDLALPALRELEPPALQRFLARVKTLVAADGKVTLFEFALHWMLEYRLVRAPRRPRRIAHSSYGPLRREIATLLAALAAAGNPDSAEGAARAYRAGLARLPAEVARAERGAQAVPLAEVGRALNRLVLAAPEIKATVIDACAYCAFADRRVTDAETELLRVVAVSLDCPLPPFLPLSGAWLDDAGA
jgi:Zn-dependent protease with chaperone function